MATQADNATAATPRVPLSETVQALRKYAAANAAFKDVCTVFAHRERARNQVTLSTLSLNMKREGYNHSKKELEGVLRSFAALGIGKLESGSRGRIKALVGIKLTLQSVGQAVLGTRVTVDGFSPANKFKKLAPPVAATKAPQVSNPQLTYPITINASVRGVPLAFPMPAEMTAQEVFDLFQQFQKRVAK